MISLVSQKQVAVDSAVVKRFCKTLSFGRSSYYRGRCGRPEPDLELRDRIISSPFPGPPTVTVPCPVRSGVLDTM